MAGEAAAALSMPDRSRALRVSDAAAGRSADLFFAGEAI
jgi:hypothetical protein